MGLVAAALVLLVPSSAHADSCPNAAFRTGPSASLPDCRAYELVSPPFKYGQNPFGEPILDGSHVAFLSLGAFGEAADNAGATGAAYIASRDEGSGWVSTPVDPSATVFENEGHVLTRLEDLSEDFGEALFYAAPASARAQGVDVRAYIRRPVDAAGACPTRAVVAAEEAGGCLIEVGPAVPPAAIAAWTPERHDHPTIESSGDSRDLSHVFFRSEALRSRPTNWLWPGDTTLEGESLYEYTGEAERGEAREPKLVGVRNSGPLLSDSEAQLISQCGTDLGSFESLDTYNAISRNGRTVFFTPRGADHCVAGGVESPVNEVYARLGGAQTVDVSEPTGADCSACVTASPRDATFQGASEDGSKVFFLSEQELLPGAAGQSLYEYDFNAAAGSKVSLIAANVLGVTRVSEQGTRVYFVAEGRLLGVRDTLTGQTTPIATLSPEDEADWQVDDGATRPVEATPDGRFLLFASMNDITPDAAGSGEQLYRYDDIEQRLVRVSIGQNGFNDNRGEAFAIPSPAYGGHAVAAPHGVAISDDGAYVFFSSDEGLTPQALDNAVIGEECTENPPFGQPCAHLKPIFARNVYEYHHGNVSLLTDGQDRHEQLGQTSAVTLLGASSSGNDVYFTTADPLVAQDTDTQMDIYDARIGGGFPPPTVAASCQGETCEGALSSAPGFQAAASSSFPGAGNLAPPAAAPPPPKPKTSGKLASALRRCHAYRSKRSRRRCEGRARKLYGHAARPVRRHAGRTVSRSGVSR
jgi:hypothetical protein